MLEERDKERSRRQFKIFKRRDLKQPCVESKKPKKTKRVEQRNEVGMYLKICLGLS